MQTLYNSKLMKGAGNVDHEQIERNNAEMLPLAHIVRQQGEGRKLRTTCAEGRSATCSSSMHCRA
jgi:hypothetical protein